MDLFCFSDLYPSSYEEWQPMERIIGLIDVLHKTIEDLHYARRLASQLAQIGIYILTIITSCLTTHIQQVY